MAKKSVETVLKTPVLPSEIKFNTPENWCWARLIQLFNFIDYRGKTPTKIETGVPFITAKNVRMGYLDYTVADFISREEYEQRQTRGVSRRGDILFTTEAPMGNAAIADLDEYSAGQRVITFQKRSHTEWIKNKFYFYYILSCYFQDELQHNKTGNTVEGIKAEKLMRFPVPVPPHAEQLRIVDRIECLFAKLDEAKEKAQSVLDGFETRKAAILHKAFTGELTAKWRAEYGVGLESWTDETIQSVCSMKITDGTHKTPTYCDADVGVPFISAKDVTGETICWDKIKYIVPELHEELYARLAPQLDDILLAKNGTTGVAAIVDVDKVFDLYVTLAVLRPDKSKILPRYLLRIVNSPVCKNQFDEHLTGIGVPNLHLRDIKEVVIQVPSLAEQAAIIQVVDSIMEKEQQAKEAAEAVQEKIDLLKKSILARAFRGELGTNDPNEESAVELLETILR